MNQKNELLNRLFSAKLRQIFLGCNLNFDGLLEIRMRAEKPILLLYEDKECTISSKGELTQNLLSGMRMSETDLRETMEQITDYSLYSFQDELKQGFMTIPGGHRIGIAGHVVMNGKQIQCVRNIAFLNIRLARQIYGCADTIVPYLYEENQVCHTLILSPPRCGKTTLLRDIIRQISDGTSNHRGRTVGVVDERSELAGSYLGIPQNDLGIRTDVLDCCTKAEGMMLLLRAMSPEVIAVDEIGCEDDWYALEQVFHCGCKLIATIHGTSLADLKRKPLMRKMMQEAMFERYILLERQNNKGILQSVYDRNETLLYRTETGKEYCV